MLLWISPLPLLELGFLVSKSGREISTPHSCPLYYTLYCESLPSFYHVGAGPDRSLSSGSEGHLREKGRHRVVGRGMAGSGGYSSRLWPHTYPTRDVGVFKALCPLLSYCSLPSPEQRPFPLTQGETETWGNKASCCRGHSQLRIRTQSLHDGSQPPRTAAATAAPESRHGSGAALHASCSLSPAGDAGEEPSGVPGPGEWRPRGGSRVRDRGER